MKKTNYYFFVFLLSFFSLNTVTGQNSQTPMMGWSSWNTFRININEQLIKETADAMVEKGLKDAGYTFVNIDDGFFSGRAGNGELINNDAKFPNGMITVAKYIHNKGLKAGIYSEAGKNTCAYKWDDDKVNGLNVGFYGYEKMDAERYFNTWGYDFIKVDYCGAEDQGLDEKTQYMKILNAISEIEGPSRPEKVRFNICRWMFPGTWAAKITDRPVSWRISHDIRNNFDGDLGIRDVFEHNLYLSAYASPGHFNDMDMMQIGRNTFSVDEEKSHFGLWCIMSSPLMIGCDLRTIPQRTLDIITNKEVIAINQDVLGLQAQVVSQNGKQYVMAKMIEKDQGKIRAVALFNGESSAKTMRVNFSDVQLSGNVVVRDLWKKENVGTFSNFYEVEVPSHGTAMLRLEGESRIDKTTFEAENSFINEYDGVKIDKGTYKGALFTYKFGASGNHTVKNIGGSENNWIEFTDVYSTNGGKYKFKLFYYTATNKNLTVTVNNKVYTMTDLNSGGDNKRGRAFIEEIELKAGYNTIRFSNASGAAPEIDKFVLLDPNDPGDDNEPDHVVDDEIIVNTKFPVISSDNDSNETWYYIQFRNENTVLQDMGDGNNVLTAQKLKDMDEQLWKVTGTANNYKIVNKSGRKLAFANGRFTTSSESSIGLNIIESTNTTYKPAWEIQRNGASGCMNQWTGAGIGKELGEWTKGDINNPLLFINAEKEMNYMPEISTDEKEVWYYIQFKKGENVIQDMGTGEKLKIQVPVENKEEQLWKVTGTKDNYVISGKKGRTIDFLDNYYIAREEKNAPLSFKFVFTENQDWIPAWELQRKEETGNNYLNQYQNTNPGQPISEWRLGDGGNMLNFITPSEMGFNDPIEGFPEISTNDNEKWYYIQFKNGNGVLQDMGDNVNLQTKGISTNDEQHWKVVQTNNTAPFVYQIVNKSGRVISHIASSETSDGLYQSSKNSSSAVNFDIVKSTNSTYSPALELHRQGSNRHMNQYKGAGIDRLISEWNKGDGGNPLAFVAIEDAEIIRAEMPEISTNEKEVWYYINFFDVQNGKTAYLTDTAGNAAVIEGDLKTQEAISENEAQCWKIVFSKKEEDVSYYKLISKTGRAIYWKEDKYVATSEEFTEMKFNELAPYWVLERKGGENGKGMSQKAVGPEQYLYDYWNSEGYGRLSFIKVENVSIPEIKDQKSILFVENKQLIVKGDNISRINIYNSTGQFIESRTDSFTIRLSSPGYYIVSIIYNNGYTENQKFIVY